MKRSVRVVLALLLSLAFGASGMVFRVPALQAAAADSWVQLPLYWNDIQCVVINPVTPTILYIGTADSGVFRSTDGGSNWTAANTGLANDIYSLAIDPSAPWILYAGTYGSGVFRSTDSGSTWTMTDTGLTSVGSSYVYALGTDPLAPTTVYAGTADGVFRSTDSGNTWIGATTIFSNVYSLAINPLDPTILYAGTYGSGVFRSTDGGDTWTAVNNGLPPSGSALSNTAVLSLAIDPLTPAVLYAGTLNQVSTADGGIYRSTDSGDTWTPVNTSLVDKNVRALAIDPLTPTTLYVGTWGGGVFCSADSASHWETVNTGLHNTEVECLAVDPLTPSNVYAGTYGDFYRSEDAGSTWTPANTGLAAMKDVKCLAVDPVTPATLYAGASEGVLRSEDGGSTWTAVNTGLTNKAVGVLVINPLTPSMLYAGTSGGGIFRSTDSGDNWTAVNIGVTDLNIYALALNPMAPSTVYAGGNGGLFRSTDGGDHWLPATNGLAGVVVEALAVDPLAPTTLYVGGLSGGVFRSIDGGSTWTAVNVGLTTTEVFCLAVDPVTPSTLYAGTPWCVFRSTDSGNHWTAANSGLPSVYVYSLAVDPLSPSILYAGTYGSGIFRSTDSGDHWTAMNAGLADLYLYQHSLAIDPLAPATMYAGTQSGGVFRYDAASMHTLSTNSSPLSGGIIVRSPDAPSYTFGATVTLTATPYDGFTFAGWSGDVTGTTNPMTIAMVADETVTATFVPAGLTYYLVGTPPNQTATINGYTGTGGAVIIPSMICGYPVTSIGAFAFASCSAVTGVVIPSSLTSIGAFAFSGCSGLTSVTIGTGVTSIGEQAFYGCSSLASVTIPQSVTSIGSYAFGGCSSLTAASFLGNAPTGTTDMFAYCHAGFMVYYLGGSSGWTNPWYGYPTVLSYALTVNVSGSGVVTRSPDQPLYASGASITLAVTSSSGYTFTGWSGDVPTGHETDDPLVIKVDADKTVTATFTAIDYGEPKSTHTWLDYPTGTTNVQSYDVDVCIDAFPTVPDPAWLYYFAIQTNFSDGGGGAHGGLQWASGGQKANWGGYDLRYAGDTQSIVVDQPWTTGTWYRYHVARGAQQLDGTWAWGFYITDLGTSKQHYLGEIYSKGSSISGCVVWMETGYGVVATTPRAQVRWRNPVYAYGALQAAGYPVAGYATYNGTCIEPHTTDQQLISTSPREWIQLTNTAVRTTPANTYLWRDEAFTLTTTSSPSAGGTIAKSPDQSSYTYGTLVTLTATPATGYTFFGWTGATAVSGHPDQATVTMDADETVTATFIASSVTPGDIDGNGTVTMLDALLGARAAVGITSYAPDSTAFLAADVNHDGIITMLDVLLIARIAVGLGD